MKVIGRARLELFLRGISLKEVSEKAGVQISFTSRCLNGRQKPSQKLKKAVSELTGLPEDSLWEGQDK